jgi:hypothetical protein
MGKDVSCEAMIKVGDTGLEKPGSEEISMTRFLHELVRDHPDFEVLCEATFYPYHFRYVPIPLAERLEESEIQQQLDRLNEAIVESIGRSGLNSVMTTRARGRVAILITMSPNGTVDSTFEAIARCGRLLYKKRTISYQTTPDMEVESCLSELNSSLTEASAI